MTSGEILRNAAMRISKPGTWLQKFLCMANGKPSHLSGQPLRLSDSWCATGAIYAELDKTWYEFPLKIYEVQLVCEFLGLEPTLFSDGEKSYHNALVRWNNTEGRTQDEVVAAFLGAAEMWEAQQVERELEYA